MRAEVIAIGDELTTGQRLDTNSQWLSAELAALGVTVHFHTTATDSLEDGIEVFRDIDSNHNAKVDQSRWLNSAGSRCGLYDDENGVIDAWKAISADEVCIVELLTEDDDDDDDDKLVSHHQPHRDVWG